MKEQSISSQQLQEEDKTHWTDKLKNETNETQAEWL